MLIHQLSLDGAFAALRSAPTGLSRADAAARRLEFGPNRIERLTQTRSGSLSAEIVARLDAAG
jgi:hypothetical protein